MRCNFSIVIPAKAGTQNWIAAFAGMTKIFMVATFVTLTLAACGRKDVPAYPTDAIDRPGTFDRERRNQNPRYY